MAYGIISRGSDGFINLHSDYSSLVYLRKMTATEVVGPLVFTGSGSVAINPDNYRLCKAAKYIVSGTFSYLLPFYKPAFNGQNISMVDMYLNESNNWTVIIFFTGDVAPELYLFVPVNEVTFSSGNIYGIEVRNSDNEVTFRSDRIPLKVDDIVEIAPQSKIKTGTKSFTDMVPDSSVVNYGTAATTSDSIYSLVSLSYGGLYHSVSKSWKKRCGWSRKRAYSSLEVTWGVYYSSITHQSGVNAYYSNWLCGYAGRWYGQKRGRCRWSGLGLLSQLLNGITALINDDIRYVTEGILGLSSPKFTSDVTMDNTNPAEMLVSKSIYYI